MFEETECVWGGVWAIRGARASPFGRAERAVSRTWWEGSGERNYGNHLLWKLFLRTTRPLHIGAARSHQDFANLQNHYFVVRRGFPGSWCP